MEAYISGSASRVVFVEGTEAFFYDLETPNKRISFGNKDFNQAFTLAPLKGCSDIQRVSVRSVEEGLVKLLSETNKDSALRLIEIALDFQNDVDLAIESSEILEELLAENSTLEFVLNYAYFVPHGSVDEKTSIPFSSDKSPITFSILNDIVLNQHNIKKLYGKPGTRLFLNLT